MTKTMSCDVIIDDVSKEQWEQYAGGFADYSIYQTWGYQHVRAEADGQELCRVVIRNSDARPAAMCQVRIKNFKPLGLRIGYVQWGPISRSRDGRLSCTVEALMELKRAFVGKRLNVLRIVPNVCNDDPGRHFVGMLEDAGFSYVETVPAYHTMMLSLDCSEDVLRSRLHQSWRRKLKKAENSGIEIQETTDVKSFEVLEAYYHDMVSRKGFKSLSVSEFANCQQMLSPSEKMNVIVAFYQGHPVTVQVMNITGDTGILLLAASNEKGFECCSSYLVWWRAVTACLARGMKRCDVGGIDFENNPTVSQFKAGLGGEDCHYIGAFEACTDLSTKVRWRLAEKVYHCLKGK